MKLIKFSIYAIVFILLTSYLFSLLKDLSSLSLSEVESGVGVPYGLRKVERINVSEKDLIETLSSWKFKRCVEKCNGSLVVEDKDGQNLRDVLLGILSENVRNVTPEQYAVAADLVGVYNLTKTFRSVEYDILSPFNPFRFSFEILIPSSPWNVTYPPSGSISISKYRSIGGYFRESFYYRGYTVTSYQLYDVVTVNYDAIYSFGNTIVAIKPLSIDFIFSKEDCQSEKYNYKGIGWLYIAVTYCGGDVRVYFDYDSGKIYGKMHEYLISVDGYHGEDRLQFGSVCTYRIYLEEDDEIKEISFSIEQVQMIVKSGWRWRADVLFRIFSIAETDVWCSLWLKDVLNLTLKERVEIERSYFVGHLRYYVVILYEGIEERLLIYTEDVPEWVKREFKYNWADKRDEELMLIVYAETARRLSEKIVKKDLSTIKSVSWEKFFGNEDEEFAKRLLEYFYLVQIPLDIKINSSSKNSRLFAFFMREANESTVSSLYTFFENTTMIDIEKKMLPFKNKNVEMNLILVLSGNTTFTSWTLNTSCGKLSVGELAYYREPGFQHALNVTLGESLEIYRGYTLKEVEFKKVRKTCRIE